MTYKCSADLPCTLFRTAPARLMLARRCAHTSGPKTTKVAGYDRVVLGVHWVGQRGVGRFPDRIIRPGGANPRRTCLTFRVLSTCSGGCPLNSRVNRPQDSRISLYENSILHAWTQCTFGSGWPNVHVLRSNIYLMSTVRKYNKRPQGAAQPIVGGKR